MKQQINAVQWLRNKMEIDIDLYFKADEIEKEQIIKAHGKQINGGFRSNGNFFQEEITGEQYYNETYNK